MIIAKGYINWNLKRVTLRVKAKTDELDIDLTNIRTVKQVGNSIILQGKRHENLICFSSSVTFSVSYVK